MDHSQSEVSSPDEVRPPLRSTERITGADTSSKDVALQSMLATALDCVVGALEATIDPTGVTFHRVPGSARARMADLGLDFASMWTSGVRIEALTDASVLELDVHFMQFTYGMTSTGTTVDVVVDGRLRDPVRAVEDSIVQVDRAT
jgi:hypothetical protein